MGGLSPTIKIQTTNQFVILSFGVDPLNWPSFREIGEMACSTSAWCTHGLTLKASLQTEKEGRLGFELRPRFADFVVTKTWNDLKPLKTIYNHLKPPKTTSKNSTTTYNHLQPPQKHLQLLANNLKQGINV